MDPFPSATLGETQDDGLEPCTGWREEEDGLVKGIWAAVSTLGLGNHFLETPVKSCAQALAEDPPVLDSSLFLRKARIGMSVVETAFSAAASPIFRSLLSVLAQCEGHLEQDRRALKPFLDSGPEKRHAMPRSRWLKGSQISR